LVYVQNSRPWFNFTSSFWTLIEPLLEHSKVQGCSSKIFQDLNIGAKGDFRWFWAYFCAILGFDNRNGFIWVYETKKNLNTSMLKCPLCKVRKTRFKMARKHIKCSTTQNFTDQINSKSIQRFNFLPLLREKCTAHRCSKYEATNITRNAQKAMQL